MDRPATARSPPPQRALPSATLPRNRWARSRASGRSPVAKVARQASRSGLAPLQATATSAARARTGRTPALTLLTSRDREVSGARGVREDHVGRLLADHVDGADDEQAGDAREHRGVDHAEPARAVDAKIAGQHATLLGRADRAGARGVMAPGVGANE